MSESYSQVPELGKRENGGERESYGTRWHELFGTPERAAQTLYDVLTCVKAANVCGKCGLKELCVRCGDYDALLEWLEGDAE